MLGLGLLVACNPVTLNPKALNPKPYTTKRVTYPRSQALLCLHGIPFRTDVGSRANFWGNLEQKSGQACCSVHHRTPCEWRCSAPSHIFCLQASRSLCMLEAVCLQSGLWLQMDCNGVALRVQLNLLLSPYHDTHKWDWPGFYSRQTVSNDTEHVDRAIGKLA